MANKLIVLKPTLKAGIFNDDVTGYVGFPVQKVLFLHLNVSHQLLLGGYVLRGKCNNVSNLYCYDIV